MLVMVLLCRTFFTRRYKAVRITVISFQAIKQYSIGQQSITQCLIKVKLIQLKETMPSYDITWRVWQENLVVFPGARRLLGKLSRFLSLRSINDSYTKSNTQNIQLT